MTTNRPIIFYHNSVEELAAETIRLSGCSYGTIQWNRFNDGWPNLYIDDIGRVKNRDVIFIASFHCHDVLFEQMAIVYDFPRYFVKSLRVIVPFYPVGTMERIDKEGEIATAKSMARIFSATPMTQSGPVIFTIFDIHALQGRFYFDDRILPDLRSAVPLILGELWRRNDEGDAFPVNCVAFPDDGARKRFAKMFDGYEIVVCEKVRDGSTRAIKIKEGRPGGKHVLIVDDLIQTGGTLIECRNALVAAGALKVSAYATHGVFPQAAWKKFTPDLFDTVWITDSCPRSTDDIKGAGRRDGAGAFEILSLAPLISGLTKEIY